jgi:hypothetical protein
MYFIDSEFQLLMKQRILIGLLLKSGYYSKNYKWSGGITLPYTNTDPYKLHNFE